MAKIQHLKDVKETYGEHFVIAIRLAFYMWIISMICLVHAICPALFEKTSSRMIAHLNENLQARLPKEDDSSDLYKIEDDETLI